MNHERILVLDFGGQYNQLIARRVRDEGVYAEVYSSDIGIEKIKELNSEMDKLGKELKQDIPSVDKSMDITSYLEKELKK